MLPTAQASERAALKRAIFLDPAVSLGKDLAMEIHPLDELYGSDGMGAGLSLGVAIAQLATFESHRDQLWNWILSHSETELRLIVISPQDHPKSYFRPIPEEIIHLVLPSNVSQQVLTDVIEGAFHVLKLHNDKVQLQSRLALSYQDIRRLTRVGQALATERNFETLIGLILQLAREIVAADAGSIYVVERPRHNEKPTHIRFKKSAMNLAADEFLLPIDRNSIAGYVALTGQPLMIENVYALSGQEGYSFNYEFDRLHNYYTKSMMVIPMKNHRDEVIGVIQLINKKRSSARKLTLEDMKGREVVPFTDNCRELVSALAGQAAVAIQNTILVQDINNLFEGFVKASVFAIEQRDPTTSGHSFRVAEFTVGLAQAVDRLSSGKFADLKFSPDQIRELRYASLLHDFGKVGVRENVLVKAKKLYEPDMELIRWRFHYIRKALEKDVLEKKLKYYKENGAVGFAQYEKYVDLEFRETMEEVNEFFRIINESNEPSVLEAGNFARLEEISQRKFRVDDGSDVPFLKQNELVSLSVRKGNLDRQERLEIESHVSHTYKFLVQIPWTSELRRIPDIAHGHHEKLDGSGYPLGLKSQEISPQTRMMTISDIYDALTASDRPYKKSVSQERAIDILKLEVKDGHVDSDLLDIFIEAEIFKVQYRS
ncbi:MAG TPA: HD domain-containing phosphohydrolase [Leptospiraceae bacterium]|nr:HD domain-containing phosphohydrolase [Leptospiraceae bacterium]